MASYSARLDALEEALGGSRLPLLVVECKYREDEALQDAAEHEAIEKACAANGTRPDDYELIVTLLRAQ